MKHFKLFMMLALLVMGVSNAVGQVRTTRTYDVEYVGLTIEEGAGYNIYQTYSETTQTYFGYTYTEYTEGIDAEASDATHIVMKYGADNNWGLNVVNLSTSNYNNYFTPTVPYLYSYTISITAPRNETDHGKIVITYTEPSGIYHQGDFIYSTKYTRSSQYQNQNMPANEVAVQLNLKDIDLVTDIVALTSSQCQNLGLDTETTDEQEARDNDNDGAGVNATYQYLGVKELNNGTETVKRYFFSRTHQVRSSHLKNAVIPAEVTIDGKKYKVTRIQKFGFNYSKNHHLIRVRCNNRIANPGDEEGIYGAQVWDEENNIGEDYTINDHSNDWLESVSFEAPDNITEIGDYAFQSCTKLESIIIPKNVTYLGTGVCSACTALTDVRFQVNEEQKSKITILRNYSFWFCISLETLELPDGITEIEGSARGAALQYMFGLNLIRLPNTLQKIGPHFLCCASSLRELTIPASVTEMDGAAFHGCESLESVYLLGKASALKAASGNSDKTFGENSVHCKEHVSGTTFYTTPDYMKSYQEDDVWCLIDEQGYDDGITRTNKEGKSVVCNYANKLEAFQGEKRTFVAGKWVTAIFPHGVTAEDFANKFGSKTRVAVPDVNTTPTMSYGSEGDLVYNVTFKLLGGTSVPEATPVMICPEKTVTNYEMISISDYSTSGFKEEMTKDHIVHPLTAEDGAHINMKGWYQTHTLMPWDFYFMYKNKTVDDDGNPTYTDTTEKGKFYRVPKYEYPGVRVGATRCWWTISDATGVKSNTSNAKTMFFDDAETTGIKNVETRINIEGIYDLQGRKIDVKQSDLPEGMFIVNGKKLIKK